MIKRILIYCLLFMAICAGVQSQIVQGIRVPSLTEKQRDEIQVGDNPYAEGQMIYNTDNNCHEYWNGKTWISLCNSTSAAAVVLPDGACEKIKVYGQYYRNAPLRIENHYIIMPIEVKEEGEYSLLATASNGYYFQANGTFAAPGLYEVRLDGMGTPARPEEDILRLTCNGVEILQANGTACPVKITVEELEMGYEIECGSAVVSGDFRTGEDCNVDNYVEIPINVLEPGTTSIITNQQNGVRFSVNKTLTSYGSDVLRLNALGRPKQEGSYTFTFTVDGSVKTTCSFEVYFTSTLGTFDNPACNCLAVAEERPFVENGEYWLMDCMEGVEPVKTYCDIAGGGWTLVWSFSEKTAFEDYAPAGMEVDDNYEIAENIPINRVTTRDDDDPTAHRIPYENYRLSNSEWKNLVSTGTSQLKVRIADDPTNMIDEWALNNYGIISPRREDQNPVLNSVNSPADYHLLAQGKVFGMNWRVTPNGPAWGGWVDVDGGINHPYIVFYSGSYAPHWDFGGSYSSETLFEVKPNRNGAGSTRNKTSVYGMNNMFGWWGERETTHHFGKCGENSDDYEFGTTSDSRRCEHGELYPHSFNNGEGRYLQWFIR